MAGAAAALPNHIRRIALAELAWVPQFSGPCVYFSGMVQTARRKLSGGEQPRPYRRPERRRPKNFSMKRPEMTNLNHQYAILRVDMGFVPGRRDRPAVQAIPPRRASRCELLHNRRPANGTVNDDRFTAPATPTMIATCFHP
jgi:hypothetical protein